MRPWLGPSPTVSGIPAGKSDAARRHPRNHLYREVRAVAVLQDHGLIAITEPCLAGHFRTDHDARKPGVGGLLETAANDEPVASTE